MSSIKQNRDSQKYEEVSDYYSNVLKGSADLKTGACTAGGAPPRKIREGLDVLDLGSGSGRDCYVCAALVGEEGSVTGVDMTDDQNQVFVSKEFHHLLQKSADVTSIVTSPEREFVQKANSSLLVFTQIARRNADSYAKTLGHAKSNMRFLTGHIELLSHAGISDSSVDLVISNCTINLSPDKHSVVCEAFRVLRPGGELHFSDIYADRRVPEAFHEDKVVWGEGMAGALYLNDFRKLAQAAGFTTPRILQRGQISINDAHIQDVVGNIQYSSITHRLFKLPGLLEPSCENYGHLATYKGSIDGHEHSYRLDEDHEFETGRRVAVSGNTAAMLGDQSVSWLSKHFEITGDRSTHLGPFP